MKPPGGNTFACSLTPPGRSALAIVGVRGPRALAVVSQYFSPLGSRSLADRCDRSVTFGHWGGPEGEPLVVVRRAADDLEVHCHGGVAAIAAILGDLQAEGCPQVPAATWLLGDGRNRRPPEAFAAVAPTLDFEREWIAAEAQLALATARGPQAAQLLAHQLSGSLAAALEALVSGEPGTRHRLASRLLSWQSLGLRLTQPWRVVVAGPPNAGKSSLVNALAGFGRSIVSPAAGTTRDVLETRLVLGGWDMVLIDTAGLRRNAGDAIEHAGIARAVDATRAADLVVFVTASDECDNTADAARLVCPQVPQLLVTNKCDLLNSGRLSGRLPPSPRALRTSALTGEGLQGLAAQIIQTLVPQLPAAGEAVPFTQRQIDVIQSLRGPFPEPEGAPAE